MGKTRSAFGVQERAWGRGGIILCLSYGQVVQTHSNHNIMIKLETFL